MIDMTHNTSLISSLVAYEDLACYKRAVIIHDVVCYFCGARTIPTYVNGDMLIRSARMCELNIAEGCLALPISPEAGLVLLQSAQSCLVDLRRRLSSLIGLCNDGLWMSDSTKYKRMWEIGEESDDVQDFIFWVSRSDNAAAANILIVLITQADVMLYKIIQSLARELSADGASE